MRISEAVLDVLNDSRVEGNVVYLPYGQLDRKLYQDVNKVLEGIGGKWNRKQRGHVFSGDPGEALSAALESGQVTHWKRDLQFFETPDAVIDQMLLMAELQPGMDVLEPSAGRGAIVRRLIAVGCSVYCCEQHRPFRDELRQINGATLVLETDFLEHTGPGYPRIIMNPPFAKQADIEHVSHAWDLLNPDGILVSVMGVGVTFRENAKCREFLGRLRNETSTCTWVDLPPKSFHASGTDVNAVLLKAVKA